MPELPEVETVRRILEPYVVGKTIARVMVYRGKNVKTDLAEFMKLPVGKKVLSVSRKGKLLCFHLEGELAILSHLRMEGRYYESKDGDPIGRYELVRFVFADGLSLSYHDTRKFGCFHLYKESELPDSPLGELGKEPFEISPEELHRGFAGKNKAVKEMLLDQTLIAGIGNIYADEVLFACKINPKTPAKAISFAECEDIIVNARRILNEAIACGGATIRSYHPKEGMNGNMQNELLCYGKESKPCPVCGFPFRKIFVGGRGTTYCPHCAPNKEAPFVVGVTGPIHSGKSTLSRRLESKGYLRFDADTVAKDLYRRKDVQRQAKKLFGKEAIVDGKPNGPYLASAMAKNKKNKRQFEAFLYPLVKEEAEKFIAHASKNDRIVLDVPLLVPSHIDELCDVILLSLASEEARKDRLVKEGKDAELGIKLNAGYPLADTKKKASFVLHNDGSSESFMEQIDALPL